MGPRACYSVLLVAAVILQLVLHSSAVVIRGSDFAITVDAAHALSRRWPGCARAAAYINQFASRCKHAGFTRGACFLLDNRRPQKLSRTGRRVAARLKLSMREKVVILPVRQVVFLEPDQRSIGDKLMRLSELIATDRAEAKAARPTEAMGGETASRIYP